MQFRFHSVILRTACLPAGSTGPLAELNIHHLEDLGLLAEVFLEGDCGGFVLLSGEVLCLHNSVVTHTFSASRSLYLSVIVLMQ